MSRIGKLPINIPKGVTLKVEETGEVIVKGPIGQLSRTIDLRSVSIEIKDNVLFVERTSDSLECKSKHGLYRVLLWNMVEGVSNGFEKKLEIIGVGYRASINSQILELSLGYSHNIMFELPKEIKCEVIVEKGKNTIISLKSHDKELLGMVSNKIRSLREPEPYKGKGIKFVEEVIRRKAGKTAGK